MQGIQPVTLDAAPAAKTDAATAAAAQDSGRAAADRIVVKHPSHAHTDTHSHIGIVRETETIPSPIPGLNGQGVQGVRQALAGVDVTRFRRDILNQK